MGLRDVTTRRKRRPAGLRAGGHGTATCPQRFRNLRLAAACRYRTRAASHYGRASYPPASPSILTYLLGTQAPWSSSYQRFRFVILIRLISYTNRAMQALNGRASYYYTGHNILYSMLHTTLVRSPTMFILTITYTSIIQH